MSFRLAAAPDPSTSVSRGGNHLAEVPQLEEQPSEQDYILPEWKIKEVFPFQWQLVHSKSKPQSQW
jgi:hypothetical protein